MHSLLKLRGAMRIPDIDTCLKNILSLFPGSVSVLFVLLLSLAPSPLPAAQPAGGVSEVQLFFFWGEGCPHCAAAKPFLKELEKKYPGIRIRDFEVLKHPENLRLLESMSKSRKTEVAGVPMFFLGDRVFAGFDQSVSREIEAAVRQELLSGVSPEAGAAGKRRETVTVPIFGTREVQGLSLPVFTLVVAGLDSFNPCAFFVLLSLLSLLVHAHSRTRMLLIGSVFVFTSGLFYFLFMAAWLNLFFLIGHLAYVTSVAGVIALGIALVNLKDFFYFKQGVSLTIPDTSKPKLFERMRNLLRTDSVPAALAGSIVLAAAANSYELLCTAGFPLVFTRVLTLHELSMPAYYAYLAFYNCIYVIPLASIVIFFVVTLGSRKLTEWQGRVLKLVSGLMMLSLSVVLLVNPSLLQDTLLSILLLAGALSLSLLVACATKYHSRQSGVIKPGDDSGSNGQK